MIKKLMNKLFKKRVETPLEFAAGVLSCWLITIASCILLDSHFVIRMGITPVIPQTFITIVVVALLTRRWWLPFAAFGVFAVALSVIAYFNSDLLYAINNLLSFFDWWLSLLPSDSVWHSKEGFYLVHTFVNIGVTILYFTIWRITRKSWTIVIVALGFVIFTYAMGYINYNFWAIPFFVAGIFPLVASEKFRNRSLPNFKTLFGLLGEKWLFAVIATVISIVICLSSIAVAYTMNDNVRTRFFTDAVSDIQTVTKVYTKEQKGLQVSLYDMGLSSNRDFIGGEIKETNSAILAYTDLTEPVFVKVSAYDTFDGLNWKNTADNSYRVNGPWKEQEENYLSSRLLEDSFLLKAVNAFGFKKTVNVYMSYASHVFPIIGQAHNFKELTPNDNQLLFDKNGRLFSYYGQDEGFTYSFDTIIYDTKMGFLQQSMKYIMPVYGNSADPLYDPECDFFKFYTAQYENKSSKIDEVIDSFGFAVDNYYDKAYKICEYFSKRNGFIYNENPPQFNKGDNIVDTLLETKEGHCVYYATAMISLTRAVGIPSRLAAGYRTVKSSTTQTQVVDRAHPYAWVECYIPHVGWMTFDPTPKRSATAIRIPGLMGGMLPNGADSPQDSESEETKDDEHTNAGTDLKWDGGPNIPLIITLPLLSVIVVLLILNTVFSQSFYRLKMVRKWYKDKTQQITFYYRDIVRQLWWLGFKLEKGETIKELTNRTYRSLDPVCAEKLNNSIRVIEEIYYGSLLPTDAEVEMISEIHELLEKELKNKNNLVLYIIKRQLLLPIFYVK